jgi:hypothetical protein
MKIRLGTTSRRDLTRRTYWLLAGIGLCLCGPLAASGAVSAPTAPAARPLFVAVNLGSLGGPDVAPNDPGRSISKNRIVVGSADVRKLDPFANDPGCLSNPCHANDAFEWQNGKMTDLGALKGYSAASSNSTLKGLARAFPRRAGWIRVRAFRKHTGRLV